MNKRIRSAGRAAVAGLGCLALLAATPLSAQETGGSVTTSNAPAAAVQLSYGVPEILKLAQGHVSDDTTIAYIENNTK